VEVVTTFGFDDGGLDGLPSVDDCCLVATDVVILYATYHFSENYNATYHLKIQYQTTHDRKDDINTFNSHQTDDFKYIIR
jgi:hypothetical protein